ncbi:MAG: hypothetical protein EPN37_00460 [Chitinophagaceae bacterium]|nr:MAG: hypothetical protein EPN37_00460 [Chitinophagaceae bacterium]
MKEEDEQRNDREKRIRFQKQRMPIDTAFEDPYDCIAEAFTWIHPDDFRKYLHEWLRIALINDESTYDEGAAREDVMDFCNELQRLIEAMNVINEDRTPEKTRRWKENLPDNLKEEMKSYNRPVLLTVDQKSDPRTVIKDFWHTFSFSYARRELWDLMDSVIFYERESGRSSSDPLSTYKCLLALVEASLVLFQRSF